MGGPQLPRPLREALESGGLLLIYGPAATGKTHLSYTIYKAFSESGRAVFIATEPGTLVFLRHIGEQKYIHARTMDELVHAATEQAVQGRTLVVDSINWHYRENPSPDYARMLSYLASLIGSTRGAATAQVAGEGLPSGAPFIVPWATAIIRTRRVRSGVFEAAILKPFRKVMLFEPGEGGTVKWL